MASISPLKAAANERRRRTPATIGLVREFVIGSENARERLRRLLKRCGISCVPHGFRSSFRDWAAEETDHPREVIEAALANVVQNQVEAAYGRSDMFERRRRLMDDWADYLAETSPERTADAEAAKRGRRGHREPWTKTEPMRSPPPPA